jgi:hypothetical protein
MFFNKHVLCTVDLVLSNGSTALRMAAPASGRLRRDLPEIHLREKVGRLIS